MRIIMSVIVLAGIVFSMMAEDSNGVNKKEKHSLEFNFLKAGDALEASAYEQIVGQQIILPCELVNNGNLIEIVAKVDGVTRTFMGKKNKQEVILWASGDEGNQIVTYHLTGKFTSEGMQGDFTIFQTHKIAAQGVWNFR
jgi:hypothetical protein